MSISLGQTTRVQFTIPQTELLAGTAIDVIAPASGFVSEIGVIVQTAVTTGGTVQAKVGTTNVGGAVVTVANTATSGLREDRPSLAATYLRRWRTSSRCLSE